jgi:hypothetical protein
MVVPGIIMIVGVGLLLMSRLGQPSTRREPTGLWNTPPAWARHLFGSRSERVQLDDLLIGLTAVLWVIGGAGLALTGQPTESTTFIVVTAILFGWFVVAAVVAYAIWYRREHWRR